LDPSGKLIFVPNATIISSMVINYTRAGFNEITIPVRVQFTQDLERVKRVILEVADADESVLPNVRSIKKDKFERLLQNSRVKKMLDREPPMEMFQPRVLITNVSGLEISLSIRLWVIDIQNREEIISNFLKRLMERFESEKMHFSEVK
jgi:small-conductance mechanosensitive channel